jgi:hypothetical protein
VAHRPSSTAKRKKLLVRSTSSAPWPTTVGRSSPSVSSVVSEGSPVRSVSRIVLYACAENSAVTDSIPIDDSECARMLVMPLCISGTQVDIGYGLVDSGASALQG